MSEDKRACRRYEVAGVTTKVLENSLLRVPRYSLPYNVINIGKGGMMMESGQQYKIGDTLDLEIEGPNTRSIFTTAQVCYRKPYGTGYSYGCKFEEIDVNVIRQVRQMCA